ncbi:hypothetical protein JCM11491_001674 [Sporobolomyces phaffii]
MGNSDLQAYLAAKYMTGAKADAILERADSTTTTKRRKKRKVDPAAPVASASGSGSGAGLRVADEDDLGWAQNDQDDDDDSSKPVVEERRGHFKAKSGPSSTWSTIRESDPSLEPARKSPTPPEAEDEKPVVVAPRGGLQSAADLRAEQARHEQEQERKRIAAEKERERKRREKKRAGDGDDDDEHEGEGQDVTVYRDSSGRKIDLKLQKAEEAKRKRQELEREMAKMEWGKGLVQREDKERAKREAEKLAKKGVARYADDAEMNDELKEVERWNDPAANFLTKNKSEKKKAQSKYPLYQGPPPPPNRFGIKPGYRWDGVDRGTGFEAKWMQKQNSRSMYNAAAHAYSTEDM